VCEDSRLLQLFQDVFSDEITVLRDQDGMATISGWDSAGHLNLIMALEAEYDVEFDTQEMAELTTVGSIRQRLNGQ